MAISYSEALAKLATITDEAGLRALIEQLDAAGDQSAKVTALWSGTQDGKDSVGKNLVPALERDGVRTLGSTAAGKFLEDERLLNKVEEIFGDDPMHSTGKCSSEDKVKNCSGSLAG